MVADCPIVITSIGDTLFQTRQDQEWGIIFQASLLQGWHWVLFFLWVENETLLKMGTSIGQESQVMMMALPQVHYYLMEHYQKNRFYNQNSVNYEKFRGCPFFTFGQPPNKNHPGDRNENNHRPLTSFFIIMIMVAMTKKASSGWWWGAL